MQYQHQLKTFDALQVEELYQILKLRAEVFVLQQQCLYHDIDDRDQHCLHAILYADGHLAAYCRIAPPGILYDEVAIGRVATSPAFRGKGLGRAVMRFAIQACYDAFGEVAIRIGAQDYVQEFYSSLGFRPAGDIYLEDGIQHIEMILVPNDARTLEP